MIRIALSILFVLALLSCRNDGLNAIDSELRTTTAMTTLRQFDAELNEDSGNFSSPYDGRDDVCQQPS